MSVKRLSDMQLKPEGEELVAQGTSSVTFVANQDHVISARGLAFQPKIVIAMSSAFSPNISNMASSVAVVYGETDFLTGALSNRFIEWDSGVFNPRSGGGEGFAIYADGFDMVIFRSAGFDASSGKNIKWIAFG